jgi:von Willebrand factor type A C-terminal domain
VCVEVGPTAVGQEMLAARVSLIASTASGPQTLGQGIIRAIWTDDETLFLRISPDVARYTGQAELAQAIQEGMEARKLSDEDTAEARLGRAVQLAHQSGNQEMARLLTIVVDVIDPASGMVWLRRRRYG